MGYRELSVSVYFIRNEVTRNVKLGVSEDPGLTLQQLQEDCRLTLLATLDGGEDLADRLRFKWEAYRVNDSGWYSIEVRPTSFGHVRIQGLQQQRKPKRRREKYSHQMCLRLSARQKELLSLYAEFKHFDTDVEAIRFMISGLEAWLRKQNEHLIAGSPEVPRAPAAIDVRQPEPLSDESRIDASGIDEVPSSERLAGAPAEDPEESSVGDFAGRPSVSLPKPSWDHGMDD